MAFPAPAGQPVQQSGVMPTSCLSSLSQRAWRELCGLPGAKAGCLGDE
jgi:hypothetical protein